LGTLCERVVASRTPQEEALVISQYPLSRRLPRTLALVAACAAAVAACGGGGSGGSTKAGEPVTLKVGTIPIADVAPLYLGIKHGFFKAQKLTVKPVPAQGGAAIVPAVMSGSDEIGFSNTTSLLIAGSKGLPIQMIASGVLGAADRAHAWDGLFVPKGSAIANVKQLEGKTVAVNNLNNVGPLSINTALAAEGVDYHKIKYVEVDFPDMPAALAAHRVDAAWMVEPFVSAVKAAGGKELANPFEQTTPNLTIATYFATKQYIAENPDVIKRFKAAIDKSLQYAQTHPAEVRQIVTTYTKIPPAAAAHMSLPTWRSDMNVPTIQKTAQLAQKYGYTQKPADVNQLIWQP
jgi:NitT/TauT family transport system substrate-binding protein